DWNQTHTDLPSKHCFYQLFENQVKQTPDNIAIETLRGESLTYQELNQKANQLALYLRSVGVSLETKVGICLERSPELIICLLAVQKAGGTYIPLDPNYPQERLNYIVEDSQLTVLLTQTEYELSFRDLTIINLDGGRKPYAPTAPSDPSASSAPPALPKPHPENLAYIIYTSGSTGKPKGTMINHQGLVNYLTWAISKYSIATGNGFPVHSSISFDATITSLYTALLVGQKIILFPEENELETLKDVLNSPNNYSAIKLTPAHLNAIARLSTDDKVVNPAQVFIIGGEALTRDAIAQWQKRAPQTKLINEYGPTEAVVGCCTYEIPQTGIFHNQIPIGSPIANTQLYILDEYLQPVPIGIPGELYIGGRGVARGYLQQPELTAEKFIPNPFLLSIEHSSLNIDHLSLTSQSLNISPPSAASAPSAPLPPCPSARLYKTGDRAKYLPDGTIEYLGRLDNQIKIRGYRIELGEIEAELTNHPDVQSALIIARDERLIAYFIPRRCRDVACYVSTTGSTDREYDVSTLRSFLQNKLPSYMVPGNFVQLDRFPLTPNGKIDRAALPLPELETRKSQIIEPSTEKEQILVEIWQEVLNTDRIGIEDNFFELGGDSILSIQIIARARQAGLTFTPKQLFQYQTIAELAAIAVENKPIQAEQGLVTGKIPLTPIQHWFFEQELVDFNHYNQAILLEVTTDLNPDWLQAALKHLVSHHDALRIGFNYENSSWTASNLESVEDPNFITVDLRKTKNEALEQSITETANKLQTSLDISQGKLVTGALFRLGNSRCDRLLLIIHHLVVDGISWRILLEDLAIAYKQLETKQSLQLPPKTTSYKSWGKTLEKYTQEIDIKSELDYWLNKKKIASIPIDKSASQETNTIASTKQISVSLDKVMTRSLLTEVPKTYKTNVEDILLTALVQSFYLWTNSKELLLDLENYGRGKIWENIDISRTVGWFTTIYPVRLQLDNFNQTGETIKSIKEQLRSYQDHGFNYSILKYLNPESTQELKQLSSSQIAFNYLGQLNPPPTESMIQGLATESPGSNRHPLGKRRYLLEINSAISDGQLQITWVYSQNFHHQTTITKLADNFLESLKNLIKYCQSPEKGGYTPSDFSAAKTSQKQLDKLIMQIQSKN
ncbi:MAG: amino acid adenylation domain-containing protein, partial [Cyanobacteria bacterium P01_F01_bin.143]